MIEVNGDVKGCSTTGIRFIDVRTSTKQSVNSVNVAITTGDE